MQLVYIVDITEIDGIRRDLDFMVTAAGFEVTKSRLESPNETSENDYEEE